MSETSDSAQVETETKLHNVTAANGAHTSDQRAARGTKTEEKKKREKERVARGGREEDVWVRTRARIGDEDEPNAKLEKKKGRVVLYTYTFKRECIARVCVCVCVRLWRWMCAEKRILLSSVERTRASSCQRTPPRIPLETNPSYRDEPPTTPLLQPRFSLVYGRSPLSMRRCLSLAHFSLHAVPQPLRAGTTRRRKNGKNARRRDTMQISTGWCICTKVWLFCIQWVFICSRSNVWAKVRKKWKFIIRVHTRIFSRFNATDVR